MLHELLLLLSGVLKLVLTLVAELRQLGWRHLPKKVLLLRHGRKGLWGLSLFHFFKLFKRVHFVYFFDGKFSFTTSESDNNSFSRIYNDIFRVFRLILII